MLTRRSCDSATAMSTTPNPFAKSSRISSSQVPSADWSLMDTGSPGPDSSAGKRKKTSDSKSPERRDLQYLEEFLSLNYQTKIREHFQEAIDNRGPTTFIEYKSWVTGIMKKGIADVRLVSDHIRRQEEIKNRLINALTRENRMLLKELEEARAALARTQADGSNSNHASYAAVLAAGPTATAATTTVAKKPMKSTTVRVADKTAAETASLVKQKIKHLQKEVRATVTVVGQNVRVACEQQECLERVKQVIKDDKTVITDRTMLKPQIKIAGIEQYDEASFVTEINEFNDGILGSNSKVATKFKNRDKVDVIIEVTGAVQRQLLAKGSLLHGFTNHRVYEHLQLRQCVKCLGLGHKKDNCKSCSKCLTSSCRGSCTRPVSNICFKCGGDHLKKDCKAAAPKCAVCLHHGRVINGKHTRDNANHAMLGKDCPLRVQGELALKNRTDYG